MPDPSLTILAPRLDGSFRWTDGGRAIDVVRTPEGFRVDAGAGTNWTIEDRRGDDGGYVFWEGTGEASRASGRTSRSRGFETAPTLLVEDGRLFRIRIRSLGPPRIELHRDATVGALFAARFDGEVWTIETTPAGELLSAPPALRWLFLAEVARLSAGDASSGVLHG